MSNKKGSLLKWIKGLIALCFIIGVATIMLTPAGKHNLRLEVVTEQQTIIWEKSVDELWQPEKMLLEFDEPNEILVKEIKVYGNFDSQYMKKMHFSEVYNAIEEVQEGEAKWTERGISIKGEDAVVVVMNSGFQNNLKELSASFLQEKILMAQVLFIICAILLIVCKLIEEKQSGNNHGPIYETKKFIGDIKKYGSYMIYAAETDLKAEVANSYLNRLWWLLEPLFSVLVYVIVFGQVMGQSVDNYATFIFSSILMWNFFSKTINYSVKLVRNNRDIVTKVYVPKFVLLVSNMFLNLFKLFFSMIILVAMLVFSRVELGINIFWVIPAYVEIILLAFGLGMIFLHFGVYVDDLAYAVGILLNMLMYLSGAFYEVMTTLPTPLNTLMMSLNPVAIFFDTMRNALLYNRVTNLPFMASWFVISVIVCCVGIHIVYKNENGYVKVV